MRLDGWPAGTLTVGVCGNGARRGSQDCAVTGDEAVAARGAGPVDVDLVVAAPPVPCPCVVRATSVSGDLVRSAPLTVIGVPSGPALTAGGPAPASRLDVEATISRPPAAWLGASLAAFAGPAPRTLTLVLRNNGAVPLTGLRVVAQVGREGGSGSPLPPIAVPVIAARARVVLRTRADLAAPAVGVYEVHGTIYGLAAPVEFRAGTSNEPWAIELLVPVLLLVAAQRVRRRERARRRQSEPDARMEGARQ